MAAPYLSHTVNPASGSAVTGSYVWASSDTTVATVSGSGVKANITAVKKGEATVTVKATAASGKELTGTVKVTVREILSSGATTWKFADYAEGYDKDTFDVSKYSTVTAVMTLYADEACTEPLTSLSDLTEDGGMDS